MPIEICTAGQWYRDEIVSLYAEAGYGAAIGAHDTVIVAKAGQRVAGVVRLCPEERVTVLRGMQVERSFQRRGIGTMLLTACQDHLDRSESFCLPYTHLESFYTRAGFKPVQAADLPVFLSQRLLSYLAKGHDVIAMRRPAPDS